MDKSENGHYEIEVILNLKWLTPNSMEPVSQFKTQIPTSCTEIAFADMALQTTKFVGQDA